MTREELFKDLVLLTLSGNAVLSDRVTISASQLQELYGWAAEAQEALEKIDRLDIAGIGDLAKDVLNLLKEEVE